MPNLISSQQALEALQTGPCRVAREEWPWGKWIESRDPDDEDVIEYFKRKNRYQHLKRTFTLFENDQPTAKLWEPEFADHSANDWYVLEPTEAECENSMRLGHNQLLPEYP